MNEPRQPTSLERLLGGLGPENPVLRQALGLCPTLAVTATVAGALTMAAAVAFVLLVSNVAGSLLRGVLRGHWRLVAYTLTIATGVTVVDRVLAAWFYDMSLRLGPYVPLIIANCLLLSRGEVCASRQPLGPAAADAAGQSLGHALALLAVATVREPLGAGSWFGIDLGWAGADFEPLRWGLMLTPPGAFLTLGLLVGAASWLARARTKGGPS